MASRGTIAKTNVLNKIQEVFGDNYIGEDNKKYYVWADDGGEKVQIAISLTCPKTEIAALASKPVGETNGDWDWSEQTTTTFSLESTPSEITEQERNNIYDLMASLGL